MVCEQNLCKSDLFAAADTSASCSTFCFHGNSCILKTNMNIHPVRHKENKSYKRVSSV